MTANLNDETLRDAWEAEGAKGDINPYPDGTLAHDAWNDGHFFAGL